MSLGLSAAERELRPADSPTAATTHQDTFAATIGPHNGHKPSREGSVGRRTSKVYVDRVAEALKA